jgi:hypothetical protein
MGTSHLFMVRVAADTQVFDATARCVEHEPIHRFTDPQRLIDFLRWPEGVHAAPASAAPEEPLMPTLQSLSGDRR